ncbi:MAG: prepilin-type N-terminal cleavage/methylation domain-containing protein [bacterium]
MNYKIRIRNNIKNAGFTIIETLVAVSILVIAVTGPLSLASKGLSYSQYAKDEITAFYLANETLDAIRNIRDTNLKSGGSEWLKLPDITGSSPASLISTCSSGCTFDVWQTPTHLESSFSSTAAPLKNCNDGGIVIYGDTFGSKSSCQSGVNPDTIFSRKIVVNGVNPSGCTDSSCTEILVTSAVSWTAKNGIPRSVIVSENMFKL